MVQLADTDIKTRDVLEWKGLHIFHAPTSSCSQKLRIFLNLKGVRWHSHLVDLTAKENTCARFLGINPHGLVPVLVHDGVVHVESNDILLYLEKVFPEPGLLPDGTATDVAARLKHEDDLHLDLRSLSFRFVFNSEERPKPHTTPHNDAASGLDTVDGHAYPKRARLIPFWKELSRHGVTDAEARASAHRFRGAFEELNDKLSRHRYLLGSRLSLLDIAWFVCANRLCLAGYPLVRLHPRVSTWFGQLLTWPEFAAEIELPRAMQQRLDAMHQDQSRTNATLSHIANF